MNTVLVEYLYICITYDMRKIIIIAVSSEYIPTADNPESQTKNKIIKHKMLSLLCLSFVKHNYFNLKNMMARNINFESFKNIVI